MGFSIMKKVITVWAIFIVCLTVCANAEVVKLRGRRLRQIVAEKLPDNNVYIGAAVQYDRLNSPVGVILKHEFRYITPENDFKQSYVHPEPGKWKWEYPDGWVKYAKENNQTIRIHGPISPQCSRWVRDDKRTAKELEDNLSEYMTALCQRYNGNANVRWMDIVNETVGNNGEWMMPQPGSNSWENPWPKIGFEKNIPARFASLSDGVPLYIIQAFEIANKKAPDIKFVINQHGDLNEKVWARIKDLVLYLRSRGLRVDGVGWQGHIRKADSSQWSMDGQNIRYLGSLISWAHENDLEFHVTENDIFDVVGQPDKPDQYADIFGNILETVLSKRDTGVVTWNLWGLYDRPHFRQKDIDIKGLWDERFVANKSYYKLQGILENLPAPEKSAASSDQKDRAVK